jgi:signal transduction histidine kinase
VLSTGISYLSKHEATRSHPELSALVETLNRNVAHASAMVTDMQTEGRRVQGGPASEPLDLGAVLAQVCEDMAPVGGPLIERVDVEAERYLVRIEPSSLRRCFENLLGNALRFAEQRVRVLTATDGDGGVVVSFDDDGPGLPDAESYRRAWEAGARFHASSGRSGSGLGLSIVKDLVEDHGGEVDAGPSALGGAQFELYLPTTGVTG